MEKNFDGLLALARKLRGENGCPWDREQTLETMFKHLGSEISEIEEALEKKDMPNLKEEIGDVIFQLIMMIQIADEAGHFDAKGVLVDIYDKIVSRHTWVFGDDQATTAEEAKELWRANKKKEKK